jgi:acyl-homoserine lactone synthase
MIYIMSGQDAARYPALMEQVYRLRHQVFVEELGWSDLVNAGGLDHSYLSG